jgi:WD40 repeat protein
MDKLLALPSELQLYNLKNMPSHLSNVGQTERLKQVLSSFQFLQAKLNAFSVMELISDYDIGLAEQQESLRIIRRALLISANILYEDKNQLAGQLLGRLLDFENIRIRIEDKKQEKNKKSIFSVFTPQRQSKILLPKYPEINELLSSAKKWKPGVPWLRPLTTSLISPDSALIRTIPTGVRGARNSAAITPDGRRVIAIAGPENDMIKVWDLFTGQEIFHLNAESEVGKVVLSSDGKQLIAIAREAIQVWNLSNRSKSYEVDENRSDIAVAANNNFFVSVTQNRLSMWNLKTGGRALFFDLQEWNSNFVTITPDSRFAVVVSEGEFPEFQGDPYVTAEGEIKFWDLSGEQAHFTLDEHIAVHSLVFTPDGTKLIYRCQYGVIKIWDLSTRQCIHTFEPIKTPPSIIGQLAVTLDGKFIISDELDRRITFLNIESGSVEYEIEIPGRRNFLQMVVMPNGKEIMTVGQELSILSIEHREKNIIEVQRLKGHMKITQDGKIGVTQDDTGKIRVWDFTKFEEKNVFDIGDYAFLEITPDGKQAITGHTRLDWSQAVDLFKVIDLDNGRTLRTFPGHDWAGSVFLSANGKWLLSQNAATEDIRDDIGNDKVSFKVRNFATGEEHFSIKNFRDNVHALFGSTVAGFEFTVTTPCGDYLAFPAIERFSLSNEDQDLTKDDFIDKLSGTPSGNVVVKIWSLGTGKEHLALRGHTHMISQLIFDPKGRWLISRSHDDIIRVWDFIHGTEIFRFPLISNPCTMELSPNGKILITGNFDGSLNLYDLENRKMLFSLQAHKELVSCLAITADGKIFASGSYDRKIKIWNTTNGSQIAAFDMDNGVAYCQFVNNKYTVALHDQTNVNDKKFLHLENFQ